MAGPPGPPLPPVLPARRRRRRRRRPTVFGWAVIVATAFFVVVMIVVAPSLPGMLRFFTSDGQVPVPAAAPTSGAAQASASPVPPPSTPPPSSGSGLGSHWAVMPSWVEHDPAPPQCVGLATDNLAALPKEQLEQVLKTASVLNCWVTWKLSWRELQPRGPRQKVKPGAFGILHAAVTWVETSNQNPDQKPVRVLVVLGEAPSWAHPRIKGCDRKRDCGPDDNHVRAYAGFARQVATQLKSILGANCFELMGWDRPNSRDHFWPDAQPSRYAHMMRAASPALKQMGVPLILADLAIGSKRAHTMPPDKFLRSVYATAGGRYWSAVGVDTGSGGWLWPQAVHNVAGDRIDVAALDVSPADSRYVASLLQERRDMRWSWLGFVLVKPPSNAVSDTLVQQIQHAEEGSGP